MVTLLWWPEESYTMNRAEFLLFYIYTQLSPFSDHCWIRLQNLRVNMIPPFPSPSSLQLTSRAWRPSPNTAEAAPTLHLYCVLFKSQHHSPEEQIPTCSQLPLPPFACTLSSECAVALCSQIPSSWWLTTLCPPQLSHSIFKSLTVLHRLGQN